MNRTPIASVVAVVAVFAGVIYFARDPAQPGAADQPARESATPAAMAPPAASPPVSRGNAAARPVASDPRLAALMVSPDSGLIEFFTDANGKVIKEIDNDSASPGFRKPLREYTYAGDKVIRLVAYKYLGGQTQIIVADVVYKPDGSVDRYEETTRYEPGR